MSLNTILQKKNIIKNALDRQMSAITTKQIEISSTGRSELGPQMENSYVEVAGEIKIYGLET